MEKFEELSKVVKSGLIYGLQVLALEAGKERPEAVNELVLEHDILYLVLKHQKVLEAVISSFSDLVLHS